MIQTNSPFSIIRSTALKELLETVSMREICMPSIGTFMSSLKSKYDSMKTNLIAHFKKQSYLCCTADVWSHRNKSYLGVSAHFLDDDLVRKSYILAFKNLTKRHTFDYLAHLLHEILNEYEIPIEKVTHFVTDGGSNFCKAFRVFGMSSDFSHSINIIYNEAAEVEQEEETIQVINDDPILVIDDEESIATNSEEESIENEISGVSIQGDQIIFPDYNEFSYNEIVLPPQMRCFAHMLNLVGMFLS